MIAPNLFIVLFFAGFFGGLGIFFLGIAALWWISIQNRELKRKAAREG